MKTLALWALSSSVLIAALILLRLCLRGRIPARLQYALWALALVRLLLPVSLFANPWSVASAAERLTERSAVVEPAAPVETAPLPELTTPTIELNPTTMEQPGIPTQITTPQQPTVPAQPKRHMIPSVSELLAIAWGAGAVIAALWIILSNLRLGSRLRRSGKYLEDVGSVPVRVTELVPSPCLFGLFRPIIYLPPAAAESEDLPYILRHERTHLRRGDHVVAALRCLCLALWWWNPLVWAAAVLSRQDGELACDEAILAELGQEQRIAYGQALLNQVPQRGAIRGCSSLSTTMSATARGLKERIRRIVKPGRPRLFLIILCLALAAVLIGCTFTGARPEIELPEQEPEVTEVDPPEETADVHISLATMEEILSADLWDYEETELLDSLTASGWTVYTDPYDSSHTFLKEIDGYSAALTFEAFDSGKIKAVSLTAAAMSEEKRTMQEEALQNLSASEWSDARIITLMPEDTDFIALCARWILETRGVVNAAGGTLTDGAMRFSGDSEKDLTKVIASFFQLEPNLSRGERGAVTSVSVGEGYFLLPDGSHVHTMATVNPTRKSASFKLTRYHAEWVNRFGMKPQPSAPDYRPNNVDGYLTINRDPSASNATQPLPTDQEQFFAQFPELDEDSVRNYFYQNPELLANGWSGIQIDQAGLDQEGTPIRTNQGDQVLAVDAVNGILLIRVQGDQWSGILAIVKDPSRVGMRWADGQQTVRQIAETNGAILGISATGASDSSGIWRNGSSTMPYAMCNGESRGSHASGDYKRLELGPDDRVIIVNADSPITPNTTDAIEYAPALIVDGALAITEDTIWNGQYPRSIIGQAENGNMMMLVVQGRDAGGSLGASVYDCAQLLYNYGCVQALNMEGGSTSILYYNGRTITVCSNPNLTDGRNLPNAWLVFNRTAQSAVQPQDTETAPSISVVAVDSIQYFRLKDLEKVSDIKVLEGHDSATLEETGLRVQLKSDSVYAYRENWIVAAMRQPPIQIDGAWYASMDFYDGFLSRGSNPSLFHGTLFFASEVTAALDGNGSEAFNNKLLNELLLPTSMSITQPHVDVTRVFVPTLLSEYSSTMRTEMRQLGFTEPELLSYSEYSVINGAKSLRSAGMAEYIASRPELSDLDPDETTVAEYEMFRKELDSQSFENDLSVEAKDFAKEKDINLSDLSFLWRYFYGSYMEQSDETLREALIVYYATDLSYVQSLAALSE